LRIPANVIGVQMSAADKVDIVRGQANLFQSLDVRKCLQVPLGQRRPFFVIADTSVHEQNALRGAHDETVKRHAQQSLCDVNESFVARRAGFDKLFLCDVEQQEIYGASRPFGFLNALNFERSGYLHGIRLEKAA
jgi:hypothetical protein